ncbi:MULTISPECIES: FAD-containing oxidoreductase [unclassified Mesorhizobium]|uniref:FAD-containing oxidoreductase n=1 Tax=unclassified Mesorhizobium TaxID=325217 RepID=UPI000FD4B776|nr:MULTISPECIES: FAD-containing oxidoreductase [unclassified Mesorhizobium]RUV91861.1 FAD-containing oxidoreductase [Mesorhizobium sp. M5C.F.Ca.IN.020.14.1.1]RUV33025.1 FAD-containing oxidoreductase [Mesorhizobium sp. M5C.F.Ca.IN.020.32.2.1]RWG48520.1 MAG: FAD-containing oxidoreductase [Mesorhizobium sp.]RWH49977.1 MAG: FAD-containing oxidoreductase [Mesorhizobium sp.]RWH57573.1 MAG: FAD-containing oxidoreductase [Mesorhizobium sp.]
MTLNFDAIIIGAGQAGPSLAGRLTTAGMKVALIERKFFGGTCVNTGCIPTKAMVASAYAARLAQRAGDYGISIDGGIAIDMKKVHARAAKVTLDARSGLEAWLTGMENCTVIRGHARFNGPHTVEVGGETLSAPRIFINVGGRAARPDMPGIDQVNVLDNTDMVALDQVPRHLVVVGGSYVGLEFAQVFRRFGAEVTVVEKGPRLVSREDEDISASIKDILEREGIAIRLEAECISFEPHGEEIRVGVHCEREPRDVAGSHVLLAVGRRPNTDDLGLDQAGIERDARGFITVDDHLATNVEGVFALGECNGRGAFTHTAYNDFEIVAANLLDGETRKVSDRVPGYALFIDPPLGRAGKSEAEARKAGRAVLVGTRPMTRVGRAVEKGETLGFMKVVADAETGKILGAAILGPGGDEAIHGILDAINVGTPYRALQWAVPIHPTVSELIPTVIGTMR